MSKALTQIVSAQNVWIPTWEPQWPQQCACCSQAHDTTVEIEFKEENQDGDIIYHRAWQVPYCSHCSQHVRVASSITSKTFLNPNMSLGSLLAVISSLVFCAVFESVWPLVLTIAGILALLANFRWRSIQEAKLMMKPECCSPGPAVVCLAHHQYRGDMHTFSFKNAEFAQSFKSLNEAKRL